MIGITLAYVLGMTLLLVLTDLGAFRGVALVVTITFVLDKIIHFVMYGVLALLVNASLISRSPSRAFRAIATGSAIVLVISTLEECSNAFTSFRTYSLADLAANYLGILCLGIVPLVAWQRTRSSRLGFLSAEA